MNDINEAIVDRSKLALTRQELGVNFARILGYFREDGAKAIAQIEEAMRVRSAVALVRPAHTLNGESLQFGAEELGLTAEAIEKAAREAVEQHDFCDHVIAQAARLKSLFAQTLAVFDREAAPPPPLRRAAGFGRKVS